MRAKQRHACGTGDRNEVLRGRPPELVALYGKIETFARALGPIEVVARDRYVLLRSTRIFADLVMMAEAVRIAIHLERRVEHPLFFKIATDRKKVSHCAKLTTEQEWTQIQEYVREAWTISSK